MILPSTTGEDCLNFRSSDCLTCSFGFLLSCSELIHYQSTYYKFQNYYVGEAHYVYVSHLPKFLETGASLLMFVESETLASFLEFLDSVTTDWPLFIAELTFEPETLEFSDDLLED